MSSVINDVILKNFTGYQAGMYKSSQVEIEISSDQIFIVTPKA